MEVVVVREPVRHLTYAAVLLAALIVLVVAGLVAAAHDGQAPKACRPGYIAVAGKCLEEVPG